MRITRRMNKFILVLSLCCLGLAATVRAAGKPAGSYPLTTCVVSGQELGGGMGAPVDYIYKQTGQPDRLVRFCCKLCLPKFKKDPAKFLKTIDDAAKAKQN